MAHLFDTVPSGFFNCLASGSNSRVYSDCLLVIYHQYDREVSYRIARSQVRDALAVYLLEHHVTMEELGEEGKDWRSYKDLANAVLRRFCAKEVGWLEEDSDDATYEKNIIMTEQGLLLAEFLEQLGRPEREEFSSYLFQIYQLLRSKEPWAGDAYVQGLKSVYRSAKLLSKALKRLSTFIRKIIERMVQEESLESLTENLIEYCEGGFVKEYARLVKQQNIHLYRSFIKAKLEQLQGDEELFGRLWRGCAREEGLCAREAQEQVSEMLETTRRFLTEDYDEILKEIKHKINLYLQIAVGRMRFLQNREADLRGSVGQAVRFLVEEMEEVGWKEELPEQLQGLFLLERNEFLDEGSLRFPRGQRAIREETSAQLETMSEEDVAQAKAAQEREAFNPYSKERMKAYLDRMAGEGGRITSDELPLESLEDLLCALSAAAYGQENGYTVRPLEGYQETGPLILRRFEIVRE